MKILLSEDQLRVGVAQMAGKIADCYGDQPVTIVSVLTGSIVLLADLIRQLQLPLRIGVVWASSYRGASSTPGSLVIHDEMLPDISGRHVLLVDDIYDTGHTLVEVMERLKGMHPLSLRSAVLLRKEGRREVELQPDFVGFDIPDEFVVGYGLDYNDAYRNLPYLAALEREELDARGL